MIETWRDIVGHEGLYRILSEGRVMSRYRRPEARGYIRKTYLDGEGYPQMRLVKNGVTAYYRVHYLVLLSFCGPRPKGHQCLHRDGDRQNVRFNNLRWGTQRENAADAIRHGTQVRGETNGRSKLTESQVITIKKLLATGHSLRSLGKRFGVDHTTIGAIKLGKSWGHLP
ncbi:MAG: hypothetical protein DRJ03_00855 [Chloroflexi bacterium]|nr:MAG: hypothetical protein DRJ03_00855 [Chloroflexota bacterium]